MMRFLVGLTIFTVYILAWVFVVKFIFPDRGDPEGDPKQPEKKKPKSRK